MKTALRQRGFSLLEMVIVVVILGIASVAVATMVSHVGSGQTENKDLQVGAQLIQECGEWIVSNHRRDEDFYTNVLTGTSSTCFSGPAAFGGFTQPGVSVATVAAGTGGCPTGAECKMATITVTKTGAYSLNPVNVMVVKYN